MLAERKKRAKMKNNVADVSRILGLETIGGENVQKVAEEQRIVHREAPVFMFWTSFEGSDIRNAMEEEFTNTYFNLFGDPIQNWKDKMRENAERRRGQTPEQGEARKKKNRRRYGVSVEIVNETFEERLQPLVDGGISTEGLEAGVGDGSAHDRKEGRRNTERMLSVIKKKRHGAEIEKIQARSKVQERRLIRHKNEGANMNGASTKDLKLAVKGLL